MNKQRRIIIWTLAAVVCVAAIIFTGIFAFAENDRNVLITKHEFSDAGKFFKKVELTVVSAQDGYSTDGAEGATRIADLQYEITLDDGELWLKSQEICQIEGFPYRLNKTNEEWMQTLRVWFEENKSDSRANQPIIFTHNIESDVTGVVKSIPVPETPITDDAGDVIGRYSVEDGKLTVVFDPIVYFMTDVYFNVGAQAEIEAEKLEAGTYEVIVNEDGDLVVENYGKWNEGQEEQQGSDYEIVKNGPDKTDNINVPYTIDVTANNGCSLAGKQMQELVPAGMKIIDAKVSIDGADAVSVLEEMTDNTYTFPNDTEITSASFTVVLTLNDQKMTGYYNNGIVETFKNTAVVKNIGDPTPLAQSNTVSTTINSSFLNKKGEPTNGEETEYQWTVEFNTSLPYLDYGFLVDRLCADDHMYDFNEGITVETEDGTYTINDISEIPACGITWNDLTAEGINEYAANNRFAPAHAYYYYLDDNTAPNPFAEIEGRENKRDCYLIIPIYGLHGEAYDMKHVTVTYKTEVNMHSLSSLEYWKLLEKFKNDGGEYNKNIHNDVILLWKNITDGEGIGGKIVPENANYGMDYESDPAILVKEGISYDSKTMTAVWGLEIGKLDFAADNVVVTDMLGSDTYDIDSLDMMLITMDTHSQDIIEEKTMVRDEDYTVDENGNVTITLGDIPADRTYKMIVTAKVISPELLATQSRTQSVENTAEITYELDGEPHEFEAKAALPAPNTLIEKNPVGSYNKEAGTFTWKIDFGRDGVMLDNGVVTDIIPDGFTYVDGSERVTPNDVGVTVEKGEGNTVRFVLNGSSDKKHTVTFETKATQAWINENLVYSKNNTKNKKVVNCATLTGSVGGQQVKDASGNEGIRVTAENTAPVEPILKSGVYDGKGKIHWTVVINDVHYVIDGCTLVEELGSELELVPSSVNISPAAGATVAEKTDALLTIDFSGTNNTNKYTVTFDTLLTSDAQGRKISNKVILKDNAGQDMSESNESNGNYDGSYLPTEDSNAHLRPNLYIHKLSSNSENTGSTSAEEDSRRLASAKFCLEAHEYTLEDGVLNIDAQKNEKYSLDRTTDSKGGAYFGNIKTTDDTGKSFIFILSETQAPQGYTLNGMENKIVYFRRQYTNADDDLSGITQINIVTDGVPALLAQGEADCTSRLLIKDAEAGGGWLTLEGYFVNTPETDSYAILKKRYSWSSFGKETAEYEPAQGGVKFEARLSQHSGQLKPFTIETNENGLLSFENFDPGTYTVTEVTPPYGMMPGSFTLKVENKDGVWSYTIENVDGSGIRYGKDAFDTEYITNEPQLTDLVLYKYEKYETGGKETQPLKGVTLKIKSVEPQGHDAIPEGYTAEKTSDAQGKVQFTGLPVGNYKIYEVPSSAKGQVAGTKTQDILLYDLTITQRRNDDGSYELVKTLAPVENDCTTFSDDGYTIYNKPITGTFHAEKVISSDLITSLNGKPLEGVQFKLYRIINGSAAGTPAYTQKSDANGNVDFTGVEYGDYELKEENSIAGFNNNIITSFGKVSRTSLTVSEDKTTFSYSKTNVITNKLVKVHIGLTKVDDDAQKLANVIFDVYRRGTQKIGAVDDSAYVINVDDGVKSYYSYKDMTVTTDSEGKAEFDLPYGDYLLVERENESLHLKADYLHVAVQIKVRNNSSEATEYSSGASLPYDESGFYTVENTTSPAWSKLTASPKHYYEVINRKRYGFIQLKKIAADKFADGSVEQYDDYPLANRTFDILCGDETYVTVTTDENGNIIRDKNADTYSGRHLWYGTYTIRETGLPDNFPGAVPEATFTICDATTNDGGTVWIAYDGVNDPASSYITAGNTVTGSSFVNFFERSRFSVQKKGSDGTVPAGAKFELYAGNTKIADLTEGENGVHTLKSLNVLNDRNVPYIIDGDRLLAGTYTLKETKAPAGYLLSDDMTIKVTGNDTFTATKGTVGKVSVTGTTAVVTDTLIQRSVTVRKKCDNATVQNLVFELYDVTENGIVPRLKDGKIITAVTSTSGDAQFGNLPEGKYVIKENAEKSLAKGVADNVYIDEKMEISVEIKADAAQKNSLLYVGSAAVASGKIKVVTDAKMNGAVTLTKHDAEDSSILLEGVQFLLEKADGESYAPVVRDENEGIYATDANGVLTISGLERGTYRLTEKETVPGYRVNSEPITFTITNADHGKVLTVRKGDARFETKGTQLTETGVKNERIYGTLTLTKRQNTSDGDGLDGAVFTLSRKGSTETYTFVTGNSYSSPDAAPEKAQSGTLKIENLPWGEYVLTETKTVPGFAFGSVSTFNFSIGRIGDTFAGTKDIGDVVNVSNKITVVKKAKDIEVPLSGAVFEVTAKNDAKDTFTLTTGENGEAELVQKLTGGREYTVRETKAPHGYKLSDQTVTFTMGMDGSVYVNSEKAESNTFTFTDEPLKGKITFRKQISSPELEAVDGSGLAGARFVLRRTVDGKELESRDNGYVSLNAISDENGKVEFANVPFGDYALYEIETAEGYEMTEEKLRSISSSELTVSGESFANDYSAEPISNTLTGNTLRIFKTEKNDGAMANVTFDVLRRGERGVGSKGEHFAAAPEQSVRTYYTYEPHATVTTDENGRADVQLPYGDYLLVERTEGMGLIDEERFVAFLAHVTGEKVTAKLYASENALTSVGGGYIIASDDGWTEVKSEKGVFIIENERKHVLVDLKKIAGNVSRNGNAIRYEETPLSRVEFTITRKGESEPLVTLSTDRDGHITKDEEAPAYSNVYIRCGEYVFAEKDTDISCEFTVRQDVRNGALFWFDYDGSKVTCAVDPAEKDRESFINIVDRFPFSIEKTDIDNNTRHLENAEFELYKGKDKAAEIRCDETGHYVVIDCGAFNECMIPYCVEGNLLPGEYTLKEIKAPGGYLTNDDIALTVTAEGEIIVDSDFASANESEITVSDRKIVTDIKLKKVYSKSSDDEAGKEAQVIPNLVFMLCDEENKPMHNGAGELIKVTTDEDGLAVFKRVPEGTYILRENLELSNEAGVASDVHIDPNKQIKLIVRADEKQRETVLEMKDETGSAKKQDDCIVVENDRIDVTVHLTLHDAETGESIDGIKFEVSRLTDNPYNPEYQEYTSAVTNEDGEADLEISNRGSYVLEEIPSDERYDVPEAPAISFDIDCENPGTILDVLGSDDWFTPISGGNLFTPDCVVNYRIKSAVPLTFNTEPVVSSENGQPKSGPAAGITNALNTAPHMDLNTYLSEEPVSHTDSSAFTPDTGEKDKPSTPETGDNFNTELLIIVLNLSLIVMVLLIVRKRKYAK